MTPEEKARRYDETLEQLKGLIEGTREDKHAIMEEDIIDIFYELKESEDEKIRKALYYLVKSKEENGYMVINNVSTGSILAWLEKQSEQRIAEKHKLLIGEDYGVDGLYHAIRILEKTLGNVDGYQTDDGILEHEIAIDTVKALYEKKPNGWTKNDSQIKGAIVEHLVDNNLTEWANWLETQFKIYPCKDCGYENTNIQQNDFTPKVEPKFEIEKGKWYVCNTSRYTDFIVGEAYYCPENGMLKPNENAIARYVARDCFHLWTIQDAKDGDVLAEDSCIFIIQKLGDNNTAAKTYYTLYDDGDFDNGSILYFDIDSTKPATKEQRGLLFQKIREAGYEWDANKKELRKIGNMA